MKTVEEVMNFVAENTFLSVWDAEDEISALDKDLKIVARGLDEDKHRWYSLATTVYKCSDGYVGVKGGYQSYSEGQECLPCSGRQIFQTASDFLHHWLCLDR